MCSEILRLDEDSPIPLYEQLASLLRDRIRAGELEPGEPIPRGGAIREIRCQPHNGAASGPSSDARWASVSQTRKGKLRELAEDRTAACDASQFLRRNQDSGLQARREVAE